MANPYLELFDYELPPHLIAQDPLIKRDSSRLMVVDRQIQKLSHQHFYELVDLLTENDALVLNQSKVFPARLFGTKTSGGKVELLLIRPTRDNRWSVISKPGLKVDQRLSFSPELEAIVRNVDQETGEREVEFLSQGDLADLLNKTGRTPTPGYIQTALSEEQLRTQYQTVYAKEQGSVAAPTAGLHFTEELLANLQQKGVRIEYLTLHVGLGTFQGVREENLTGNSLHKEQYAISQETLVRLNSYKKSGKRIIAVGTTSTRTLESAVNDQGLLEKPDGDTSLFIKPPYQFRFVDAMITNFHIPRSSLLMLVSAFTTKPNTTEEFIEFKSSLIGQAYQQAIEHNYRFYSFGDAMFIV